MVITEHKNGMWGVIIWSGDVDGHAALITSSRLGVTLWVFRYVKGGWFTSEKSYWEKLKKFKDKETAFETLGIKD